MKHTNSDIRRIRSLTDLVGEFFAHELERYYGHLVAAFHAMQRHPTEINRLANYHGKLSEIVDLVWKVGQYSF